MADVQNRISQVTSENNKLEFDFFKSVLNEVIQRHSPIKQRNVCANQIAFINKKINKEIMKGSRLRNKFLNTKSDIDRKTYNRQRTQNFFNNISTRDTGDNKTFWKTVKLLFKDKVQAKSKIALIEKTAASREGQEQIISEKVISED